MITGNLNLCFFETIVRGAIPFPIRLTYSSGSAQEAKGGKAMRTQLLRNTLEPSAGWSIFPHLTISRKADGPGTIAYYAMEPTGAILRFVDEKPDIDHGGSCGIISGRKNPANHRLTAYGERVEIFLADHGIRVYQKAKNAFFKDDPEIDYYMLIRERLPSGHHIFYYYDDQAKKIAIQITNPVGTKILSKMTFEQGHISASGETSINFGTQKYKNFKYLTFLHCAGSPRKNFSYKKLRHGVGPSLDKVHIGDKEATISVDYYAPSREKDSKKWEEYPDKKPLAMDKVKTIRNPAGTQATFEYYKNLTCVRDTHGILTKYLHSDHKLDRIEYFGAHDELISSQQFTWENGLLIEKAMCDRDGNKLFSKTFEYDSYKNVTKETLHHSQGSLSKWYTYDPATQLLVEEREEDGPTTRYEYLPGTDLLTHRVTDQTEERYIYDEDNLLIEETTSDKKTIHYQRDPRTGLVLERIEPLQRRVYTYNQQRLPVREDVYDANNEYRYSLYTEYDSLGRTLKQTTPTGGANTYCYDGWGRAITVKEVGKSKMHITYDALDRPISVESNGKRSTTAYDPKGWVLSETDYRGQRTTYEYDPFGHRIQTHFPDGTSISNVYDLHGNITSTTDANGHTMHTEYNIFKKPTHLLFPNGGEIFHTYSKHGDLIETTDPNGSATEYTYDALHRPISKRHCGQEENWDYEDNLLKSYTDPTGLTTTYTYDEHSRKIEELTGERSTRFTYDPLGFLEKTTCGDIVRVTRHDLDGKILETHENGFHHTAYTYDQECRKAQAKRGDAIDRFIYDSEGRLAYHTNPLGHITRVVYGDYSKTTIDPIDNINIETFDPMGRLIQTEKCSPRGNTYAKEGFEYDNVGNIIKRITTVFHDEKPIKTLEVDFEYNSMNLLVRETEADQKTTTYDYDIKGRLISKTSPNGTSLYYTYDDLDRMTELKSSDGTVHYRYIYNGHSEPIAITDVLQHTSLMRYYTPYGEIASERFKFHYSWNYDTNGRVTEFTLPDESKITYSYQNSCMTEIRRGEYSHIYSKFDRNKHIEEEKMIQGLGTIPSKRDLLERPIEMTSPYHKCTLEFGPSSLVTKSTNSLTKDKTYTYDHLNQLETEGEDKYHFDSLGNSMTDVISDLNQVIATKDESLAYDPNGNLIERTNTEGTTKYTYDALHRLTSITYPDGQKDTLTYDPLSRLFSKNQTYYLYDKEFEIGTFENNNTKELKVLGLGINGDIGAAVALELNGILYAPLHDLQGNIIGLVDTNGNVTESYDFTSFGWEMKHDYENPWRFASKRDIHGLIFFGKRFYDPKLKRWITPDPLGFDGGRNLYAYVFNSPTNRLDLFGLCAAWNFYIGDDSAAIPYGSGNYENCWIRSPTIVPTTGILPRELLGMANLNGVYVNLFFTCDRVITINYTPLERAQGHFNLFDHKKEIWPDHTSQIALQTYMNGVNNNLEDFQSMGRTIAAALPSGVPVIGIFAPTQTLLVDVLSVGAEFGGATTPAVRALTEFVIEINDLFETHNPRAKWSHADHSGASAKFMNAMEALSSKTRETLSDRMYYTAFAPAKVTPKDFCHAINYYSSQDGVTLRYAKEFLNDPKYDIRVLECITPKEELGWFTGDHSITSPTQRHAMRSHFDELQRTVGFYVTNRR